MLQQGLIIALLLISLGSFFWTLWRRLSLDIVKDRTLPTDNLHSRTWRVFKEVILQSRVIKNRPVVGFMHALVMWGFLVFAWVSLNHLWLGFTGFQHAPVSGWYRAFAAGWAVAVLAGISHLAYRRFFRCPKELGELSVTSGIVSALIIILMVTYFWEWLDYSTFPSGAWLANWWIHTLALLGFLFVIPRSKHLHLVLAPVAIFFRSDTTSKMRALNDKNEEFGLIKFSDLRFKDVLDINACVECGRCTVVCPANLNGQTLDPKAVILQMQRGLLAKGDNIAGTIEEVSAGKAWVTEADLFQCYACGACEQACPVGIEHVGAKILDARRGLVSDGRDNNPRLSKLFSKMRKSPHNPWGFNHEIREKFIGEATFPVFDGSQEWLFWLGCGNSYDPHGQNVAKNVMKILNSAKISWGVLENETCCGEPARRTGDEAWYQELSKKLITGFKNHKVKNIVTCCPHCLSVLNGDYQQIPEYTQLNIRVLHHTQLIEQLLPRLTLEKKRMSVSYHDPCNLARGQGVTAQPRTIIGQCVTKVVEMKHCGKDTNCCGAGGGQLHITDESDSRSKDNGPEHRRVKEFSQTGADVMILACTYCKVMMGDKAKTLDIAELVADCIKIPDVP